VDLRYLRVPFSALVKAEKTAFADHSLFSPTIQQNNLPMDLKEKVEKQISAGFSKEEINQQLLADGHTQEEINQQLKDTDIAIRSNSQVSGKAVLIGIGLIVMVIIRIARYSSFQSSWGLISIITGILVVIFYLARRH